MAETVEIRVTKSGGKREGAGRPVTTTHKITHLLKQRMTEKLWARIDPILDAHIETAIGNWKVTKTMTDIKGNISTVEEEVAPSHQSAKLLLEYVLPKPEQKIEHSGGIGIVHLIKNLESGNTDALGVLSDEDNVDGTDN